MSSSTPLARAHTTTPAEKRSDEEEEDTKLKEDREGEKGDEDALAMQMEERGGEDATSTHEVSFFKLEDKEIAIRAILALCKEEGEKETHLADLQKVLEKYQEQRRLLDRHLEDLISPVMEHILEMMEAYGLFDQQPTAAESRPFPYKTVEISGLHIMCRVLQLLCRIRGYKYIMKHFAHEVRIFEPCLHILKGQDRNDHEKWEIRYILLLWLAILSLVPFDITSLDTSIAAASQSSDSTLVSDVYDICLGYLGDSGPTRDAAAECLATLLTRPDMALQLGSVCTSGATLLTEYIASSSASQDHFRVIGLLQTLASVFKIGHREILLPHTSVLFPVAVELSSKDTKGMNALTRKLVLKLLQRVSLCFLRPVVATWRYQRGHRSLLENLSRGPTTTPHAASERVEQNEEYDDVPQQVEDVIEQLLLGLRHSHTIVRWSAAKGIGRITARLPKEMADEVIGTILESFLDVECDSAWHGACLAVAEVARRGLLLPTRLVEVTPLVVRAMSYDVVRGQHSVGAHVRDAACYVCWAFARAFAPEVMCSYVEELSAAMLLMSLFDREVNCRRAASAAFQESVGRQGDANFKHGIEIVQLTDYFSIGNRQNCYLQIAPKIARLEPYKRRIIDHLRGVKLVHWDVRIRELAAHSLRKIAVLDAEYMAGVVLPDLLATVSAPKITMRHGGVIGCAEIVLGLGLFTQFKTLADRRLVQQLADVIPALDQGRLYRGRGGEMLREGACMLICNLSRSGISIPVKATVAMVEAVNECLRHSLESIQVAAVQALRQILYTHFSVTGTPSERLQNLTVQLYVNGLLREDVASTTRGYALALGALPAKLCFSPKGTGTRVISALTDVSSPSRLIGGEPDAETRRNAIYSLAELVERLGLGPDKFTRADVEIIFTALYRACNDYSTDKRGDVGSWSRMAALTALERVVYACTRHSPSPQQSTNEPFVFALCSVSSAMVSQDAPLTAHPGAVVSTPLGFAVLRGESSQGVWEVYYSPQSLGAALVAVDDTFAYVQESALSVVAQEMGDQQCVVQIPDHEERGQFSLRDYLARAKESLRSCTAIEELRPIAQARAGWYLDALTVERCICAVLKQLSEKMDAVRAVAGPVLVRLLTSSCPRVPFFPHRTIVKAAVDDVRQTYQRQQQQHAQDGARADIALDSLPWAQPSVAFALVFRLVGSSTFMDAIAAGICISVGDLTESVSSTASRSLLEWCRAARSSRDWRAIGALASALTKTLAEHTHDARVCTPLLRTLDVLLRNKALEALPASQHPFARDTLAHLRESARRCSDITRLRLCADVLVGLAAFGDDVRPASLRILSALLVHRFPLVRKHAAEQLYVLFLSDAQPLGPPPDEVPGMMQRRDERMKARAEAQQPFVPRSRAQKEEDMKEDAPIFCGLVPSETALTEAQELLTATVWDGDIAQARVRRAELCMLMGLPVRAQTSPQGNEATAQDEREGIAKESGQLDELDSYASLVKESGY